MALTAAEKMRRYRQKIKDNPEKYEKQKKKDLERMQINRKKISQLDDTEKEKLRKQWRDQKKRQRKIRKTNKNNENPIKNDNNIDGDGVARIENSNHSLNKKGPESDSSLRAKLKYMKKKCYVLSKKLEQSKKNELSLKRIKDALKKRMIRQKKTSEEEIKSLKLNVDKMKAREEILEATLTKTYKNSGKQAEKKVLRRIVENAKVKTFVAKLMGLSGRNKYKKKTKSRGRIREIELFFNRDDVSRCTAGKKECRTKNKEKRQIRYLLDTLDNLYIKYRSEGGRYKLTTFRKYKPFFVLAPHLASRDTCLCVKHDNMKLKLKALIKSGLIEHRNIKDVLQELACDLKSHLCMYGKCMKCKNNSLLYKTSEDLDETVAWNQWERKKHEYLKKDGTEKKTCVCVKTEKVEKISTLRELLRIFEADLKIFKKHHYNVHHQQEKYQEGVTHLKENEALVICDFSQNYESKLSSEIQSMHFGASKCQISLHTGMIYLKDTSQSFCTLSPNTVHQPQAIWAHLKPVLKYIEEHHPQVTVIHFYSDGPTSQYRQKNNFYLLGVFRQKLNLDHCTWSFFESGHGKGVADGIGGTVKRVLDRNVCFGRDISNASDAFEILKDSLNTIKIWYISEEDIDEIAALLPQKLPTLVGTMQLHQITTKEPGIIIYRDLGCFCGPQRGLCTCYGPKIHKFYVACAQSKTNSTTESTGIEATGTLDDIETSDLMNVDVEIDLEELAAMDNVNFSSIGDPTKPSQTNSATEDVDLSFFGVAIKPNINHIDSALDEVDFSSVGNATKPNTSQTGSPMDEEKVSSAGDVAKPNISQAESKPIGEVDFSPIGDVTTLDNSQFVFELIDNTTLTKKNKINVEESSAMDCLNILYVDSEADAKQNIFEADSAKDIQLLDQIITNDKTSVKKTTAMDCLHITQPHPADHTETNISQADSVKEKLTTLKKIPYTIDLTINPLKIKLTGKSKNRSNGSVLCASQPKVKKNNEGKIVVKKEINSTMYSGPCTSKNLPKSTVSILSNISLNSNLETKKTSLPRQSKGLKTVVKRAFTCYKCNGPLLSNCITKCVSCCNRFCLSCGTGEVIKDYICENCLC